MAGFEANAFVDGDVLEAFQEALQADRSKVRRVFAVAITKNGSAAERMRQELSKEPGRVVYTNDGKLRWRSAKQRRKVMAMLREQGNLPYERTHQLAAGWQVLVDSPLDVLVVNRDPAARYVQGEDQQPFHIDTGWPYAPGIIREYADEITDELATAYLRFIAGYEQ